MAVRDNKNTYVIALAVVEAITHTYYRVDQKQFDCPHL